MSRLVILGSTGSIGTQTLDVVRQHPELFQIEALAAGHNTERLAEQIEEFCPKRVVVADKAAADRLRSEVRQPVQVSYGEEALLEAAAGGDADYVVSAMVGSIGLKPTLAAIEAGRTIGLANKETLVTAGHIVTERLRACGVTMLPIDSEHSAIYQCLQGEARSSVAAITLTASGGSFRDRTRDELKGVTVEEALNHPNWSMGAKITIDSATMVNKGLEVIEAHWLFQMPYEQIKVLIHPESIIHSFVQFADTSVIAQLGLPDMRVPIQYALSYPDRLPLAAEQLDLAALGKLQFKEMDFARFPCLRMAYESGRAGGSMPTVFNAANEAAVARFLRGEIEFLHIETIIEQVLAKHQPQAEPGLEAILEIDAWARRQAEAVSF
ncbi:1-deoxy-D-xylulose 5-phosphate reductoisomerase 2 [Xylanibacillus composti]|uniref:1-deoxy-D-xylulose 5-phosphate reductoisomerase n=1 Tax=Xylanibacillus composti TaxID=1572762 RepID=A0A8J4H357_9BACL|nr:1-deoxy-D-xylulose-5-phosphate reductoisomerase [Xylanibacillus composti]GIQ68607.1 1-deoxy-D-xylulose 5-phosphate reductoisomerase 2 [Xylanibacillus composti]